VGERKKGKEGCIEKESRVRVGGGKFSTIGGTSLPERVNLGGAQKKECRPAGRLEHQEACDRLSQGPLSSLKDDGETS